MDMSKLMLKKTHRTQEDTFPTAGRGRYIKTDPPSPSVKDYLHGVHRPPPKPRSEQATLLSTTTGATSTRNITNARSLSVPSLRTNVDMRVKESPPHSPAKPRSTSVRLNPKKTLSFKKTFRKIFEFGSRSELEDASKLRCDEQTVGTYHKISSRPRSIGSDCSNSSYTYATEFVRNDSFRVSGHSRVSHGIVGDSVFDRNRQHSYDSNDIINHTPSNSTDSNLRPYSIAMPPLPRSCSSSSLRNISLYNRVNDNRHHSIAAVPIHSTDVPSIGFAEERSYHRRLAGRIPPRTQEDTVESLWVDSSSFDFSTAPVLPSHPEYPQIAQDLMTASPPRRPSPELPPLSTTTSDMRRMSDTGTTVDPRRVSNDSGVESSKPFRSQPSTPVAQTLTSVRTEGTSSPETHTSPPHDYLSQGSSSGSLPPGWTAATTPHGLTYYLDHHNQTTHWKLPDDTSFDDSTSLPPGWEVVQSSQYGTYFVNHNNKTAMYQHPCHSRPPPPYQRAPHHSQEAEHWSSGSSSRERRPPPRSHSYRDTQNYRVMDPNTSLPRRSKSFKDQEKQNAMAAVCHSKQLSTVTYVPPSPYQIAEIPTWLKAYVEAPYGSEKDYVPWNHYTAEDLNGLDTMIKRMLKKGSEQIVRQFEYYRVAMEQEINSRGSLRQRRPINQLTRGSSLEHRSHHFQYPIVVGAESVMGGDYPASHTTVLQNNRHVPYQPQSHSHVSVPRGMGAIWSGANGMGGVHPQLAAYASWSSSEHSNSSTRTLRPHDDLEQLQKEKETFV